MKKFILKTLIIIVFVLYSDYMMTMAHEEAHTSIAEYHGYEVTDKYASLFGNGGHIIYKVDDYGSDNYWSNEESQSMVDIIGYPLQTGLMIIISLLTLLLVNQYDIMMKN